MRAAGLKRLQLGIEFSKALSRLLRLLRVEVNFLDTV
jgi:hypothetical protein